MKNSILFCSYYTRNTIYEKLARRLADSLDNLGLDYRIESLPEKESWVANCAQKACIVSKVVEESDRPVCWLDADAVIRKYPETLMAFESDFGILAWRGWQFSGGQVLFGNTQKALNLARKWKSYAEKYPNIWDQVTLAYAWWDCELADSLDTLWLPETLIIKRKGNWLSKIRQELFNRKAEIFHWQASRETKTPCEKTREFNDSHLPQWWRRSVAAREVFELSDDQKCELGLVPDVNCSA